MVNKVTELEDKSTLAKKINLELFFVTAIALFVFDLYKASHAPFTYDESFSYTHYVHLSIWDIFTNVDPAPNNHILNSLLMKLFAALFGTSELALRFPNILAHLLYMFFTYKLISRVANKNFIFLFIIANINPFLIDFFTLARGYGLAIGLMTAGIYFYCQYLDYRKNRNHFIALIFIGLAVFANFALFNVLLVLILVHNIFRFLVFKDKLSVKNILLANWGNLIVFILVSVLIYVPLSKIFDHVLTDFYGMNGFWKDTVISLSFSSAYHVWYENYIYVVWEGFVLVISVLFVLRSVKYFKEGSSINFIQKNTLLFGLIVFFIVISSITQHLLFKTPFLNGRFALFVYPLFVLGTCFLLLDMWNGIFKYLIRSIAFTLSAILFIHFCFALNTSSYYGWIYDSNTKNAITMIKNIYENGSFGQRNISVGNTWLFESTMNFYRETYSMNYLEKVSRSEIRNDADFFYIDANDTIILPSLKTTFSQLCKFDESNTLLLKRKNDPNENYSIKIGNAQRREINRLTVQFKAASGRYLCDEAANNYPLWANKDVPSTWETFSLIFFSSNECCIRSFENKFVHIENESGKVYCNWPTLGLTEYFIMSTDDKGFVSFKAANGKILSLDEKSELILAKSDSIGRLEKFKLIKL